MEYYDNSKRPKKPMTEEQALLKLTTFIHISQLFTDKNTNFANTILNEYEYGE